MAPTGIRIPAAEDFEGLPVSLHFPSPPESTTAILIVFHGLGDSEANFSNFARTVNLPGVLAITVRGISPLPPSLLGLPLDSGPTNHFHWGDDITLDPATGELDQDPGFTKAADFVLKKLIHDILVDRCGWELGDILFYGYGQGGQLALGLASKVRESPKVEEIKEDTKETAKAFKGVVSIGGSLPGSMVPGLSTRDSSKTPILVCRGRESEAVDDDAVDLLKKEFVDVKVKDWNRAGDTMPESRDEMLPIMDFFAERLRSL